MTPAAATLRAARAMIERRSHWGRGVMARDRHGRRVPFDSELAVRFCVVGAVAAAAARDRNLDAAGALNCLQGVAGALDIIGLMASHDMQTHRGALGLLDRAVELAERVPA